MTGKTTGRVCRTLAALTLGAAALAGCSSQDDSIASGKAWQPGQVPLAKPAWTYSTAKPVTEPVIVGTTALLYTSAGGRLFLTAVNTTTGKDVWPKKPASVGEDDSSVPVSRPVVVTSGGQTLVAYLKPAGAGSKLVLANVANGRPVVNGKPGVTTRPRLCYDDPKHTSICVGRNGQPAVWQAGAKKVTYNAGGSKTLPTDFPPGGKRWSDGLATDSAGELVRWNSGAETWFMNPKVMKSTFGKYILSASQVVAHADNGSYVATVFGGTNIGAQNVADLVAMVGIDQSSQKRTWPPKPGGDYLCNGWLSRPASGPAASDSPSLPLACDVHGTSGDFSSWDVKLYGFNPANGVITWGKKQAVHVGNATATFGQPGSNGVGGAYAGTKEIVINPASPTVVDLTTGKQRAALPNEVFLCRSPATAGLGQTHGDFLLTPCNKQGTPLTANIPQRIADQGLPAGNLRLLSTTRGLIAYKPYGW